MKHSEHYPHYISYRGRKQRPSVLAQHFPLPSLEAGEVYYPENPLLTGTFTSEKQHQLFGAAQFTLFLNDTIFVEHKLVVPAIVGLRELPFSLPQTPTLDLFKTATDEMFHAEQSLAYMNALEDHFHLPTFSGQSAPLFIRKLYQQIKSEKDPLLQQLLPVINGIVTETRISLELGEFAKNTLLSNTVRDICRTHAIDEVVHASQFKALAEWLWFEANQQLREQLARLLVSSAIARSLPDMEAIIKAYAQATGRSYEDASQVVRSKYDEDVLIEQMLVAAHPTFSFLKKLGVTDHISVEEAVERERSALHIQLNKTLYSFPIGQA